MMTEPAKTKWRLPRGWQVWLAMTALGVALSMGSWFSGDVGAEGVKPLFNAVQVLVFPGWAVVRLFSRVWHASPLMGAVVANAIGWGLWWAAVHVALRLRRGLLRKIGARAPAEERVDPGRRRWLVDAPLAIVS